jgi:hypothetical protein
VTGDAEKSEGGEQRVRCREVEVGVHFIGPGRRWGGGEAAGGGGVLLLVGFEGVKGGRGDGTRRFSGGSEGGMMVLWFGSSRVEEGGSQQRTARRRGQRGGSADGSRRWEPMERQKWAE